MIELATFVLHRVAVLLESLRSRRACSSRRETKKVHWLNCATVKIKSLFTPGNSASDYSNAASAAARAIARET